MAVGVQLALGAARSSSMTRSSRGWGSGLAVLAHQVVYFTG